MALATKHVPLSAIEPHPNNVRQGDIGAIATSLETHGQYRPIVVQQATGRILAGNHTYKAAAALGWDKIAVVYVDVDDDQAQRIMLVDNRTNDLATYDDSALGDLLTELAGTPGGLEGTGYDGDDLDELLATLGPSDGDERYTPAWIFEGMRVEFDVDLAAPPGGIPHIPTKRFFTKDDDALSQDWRGLFAWCNPPYSIASKFGEKWLDEITDGVWLGPVSHSTMYRVRMFDIATLLWFPGELEFEYRGNLEGIAFPVFLGGFGAKGHEAISNLEAAHPGAGQAFTRWHNG